MKTVREFCDGGDDRYRRQVAEIASANGVDFESPLIDIVQLPDIVIRSHIVLAIDAFLEAPVNEQ